MADKLIPVNAFGAQELKDKGALLVDVREPHEHAQMSIPGSHNVPLSRLAASSIPVADDQAIVFFCAAGSRTASYAAQLAAKAGDAPAYVMNGGISGWRMAGLPVDQGSGGDGNPRGGFFSRLLG